MLSTTNIASAKQAGRYFAADNYYTAEENQERSAWQGQGAVALGFSGEVDVAELVAILEGRVGGQQLGRHAGNAPPTAHEHRPGLDMTLSAPKSVSLLAEVGGQAAVRAAHEAAVDAVLHYAEQQLAEARVTERGVTQRVRTGNLLIARFHHNTSRDLDPQTHTHLVIANATQLSDGRWGSLSNEALYGAQKLLGAIYDSELAANLRGLGYRIEATEGGRWEVAGFTRDQLEHFSQRSKAIEERLARFGLDRMTASAAQKEEAALRTRPAKRTVDHAALGADWRVRAAEQGIDFGRIEAYRENSLAQAADAPPQARLAAEAVRFAVAHLTERESVVGRDDLLSTALNHAVEAWPWAQLRLPDMRNALDGEIARGAVLRATEERLTTPDGVRREQLMLQLLEQGRGQLQPLLGKQQALDLINRFEGDRGVGFGLTSGQEMAVLTALGSRDRFTAAQGFAGVGKTTVLKLVLDGARQRGIEVRGMAPSAEAAAVLHAETGIPSTTVARFLQEQADPSRALWRQVRGPMQLAGHNSRTWFGAGKSDHVRAQALWVVDEASLAGTADMLTLMARTQASGARLLLVGDRLQLNGVAAGKPFEILLEHGIDQAEMTEISRQRAQDLRDAVTAAVQRDNQLALTRLSHKLVEHTERVQLMERMAGDVLAGRAAGRSQLILVPRRQDREELNQLVRGKLQHGGAIARDEVSQRILSAADLSAAQCQSAAYYREGMVLRFAKGLRGSGIKPGSYADVVQVSVAAQSAVVRTQDGTTFRFRPADAKGVEVYTAEQRALAVGDELRFTRNQPELGLRNGSRGTVATIGGDFITLETARGPIELARHRAANQHLEYAYALTVHAAQGKTAEIGGLLMTASSGRALTERAFYVGITRFRDDIVLYTDSKPAAMRLIATAIDKTSALEEMEGVKIDRTPALPTAARDQSGGLER